MTAFLIGITCVLMNCFIGYSGKRYMDSIGSKYPLAAIRRAVSPIRLIPKAKTLTETLQS